TTAAGVAVFDYFQQQQQQTIPLYRRSEEFSARSARSARSMSFGYPASRGMAGRFSFDQDREFLFSQAVLPPLTPTAARQHARAPNSRAGLTDETIPGDPSFLPAAKRQPSRLLKMPPAVGSPSVTTAATAAATTGGTGAIFSSRRNSHSNSDRSNRNTAYWGTRTRSRRSCSTVSYASSEVTLNKSFGPPYQQRQPSVAQHQTAFLPRNLRPRKQSPKSVLYLQPPVSPSLPFSTGPVRSSDATGNPDRPSIHSMYHEYLHQEKQPRKAPPKSTPASLSSTATLSIYGNGNCAEAI
ncbi:hypothetical protein SEUCBS140593_005693, partial [Sporothrix eucalyptigena]